MKMTEQGRKLLMEREGCRLKAYKDSVGVWTIGVGHTSGAGPPHVKAGMTITQAHAEIIFADDVAEFEEGVSALLGDKPIEPTSSTPLSALPSTLAWARSPPQPRCGNFWTARMTMRPRRSCFGTSRRRSSLVGAASISSSSTSNMLRGRDQ